MRWSVVAILLLSSWAAIAKEQAYRPPRLPDGQPDLQGVWVASNATPLERPARYTTRVITASQANELLAAMGALAEDRATPTEPTEYFEDLRIEPIRGELRSSLIVDPANGLIPGNDLFRTQLAQARAEIFTAMDGVEQRPAPERCLGSQTMQPPLIAIRAGVNLHQIVQAKDTFLLLSEFVHSARIIRLNSRHQPASMSSWLGDSIGRWEDDTLVVETRGFTASDRLRMGPNSFLVSPRTAVTERYARVADDRIDYTFTVDDPTFYTQPWTGESHFMRRDEQIFEFACHEANYSLQHVLEGARARDGQSGR